MKIATLKVPKYQNMQEEVSESFRLKNVNLRSKMGPLSVTVILLSSRTREMLHHCGVSLSEQLTAEMYAH